MKLLKTIPLCCVTLIVFFTFSQKGWGQHSATTFKVLSYNIQAGQSASLEEIAHFIKKEDPDFVALQEVDSRTFREEAPEQDDKAFATELGYRTGMFPAFGKTIPFAEGYYGIAVLSKYPIAKLNRIYLPKTEDRKEQRALLMAQVEYEKDHYVTFASTHLDYTTSEERQKQVGQINAVLTEEDTPVILAGDFNAEPDAKEIQNGMQDWTSHYSPDTPTFSTEDPHTRIDYIFSYPQKKWEPLSDTTYTQVRLSDHLPIGSQIKLRED